MPATYDVVIIGGGIVGLATGRALLQRSPHVRLLLVEKEARLASHQTGRNSGVVHSGIYYRPNSLKAALCRDGAQRLTAFCHERGLPYRRCGKVIVAVEPDELSRLAMLEERGRANHIPGLSRIGPERLHELEPCVRGLQALHLPEVGIVDYVAIAYAFAEDITRAGGTIQTDARITHLRFDTSRWHLETPRARYRSRLLINCGGLHSDRLARLAGDTFPVRIVPFRGEYSTIPAHGRRLVNGLVYPVPNPAMPFLGVHFTPTLAHEIHVGPNAVLALKREGYRRGDINLRDCVELVTSRGFWRMARRYWSVGLEELARAWDRRALLKAAQRLVPSLKTNDLWPSPAGVRAQAVGLDGSLLDDFVMRESAAALHIYNAPSPAATASLSIGDAIAQRLAAHLA